ncbi:MAG: bacterial cellulose synthase subunit [Rhizobium sp.]|nr:bacterial cellulose synthase subunit [Rhizobium sp.]
MSLHQPFAMLLLSSLAATTTLSSAKAAEPAPFQLNQTTVAPVIQQNTLGGNLRKMAANQFELFFGGEYASRTLSFFALPDEAATSSTLVLTLQTAISVAPEQSRMVVKVNGADVGSTGLIAGSPRRIEFNVPAGVIHPGYNAVTIEADQRHRVDCSINATYELWTKIDPEQSGFLYANSAKSNLSLVDLLPLSGTTNGRTAIRIILPPEAQMGEFDRALNVVQALTILGNFNHPAVEFASTPGTGAGIDVYLGTKAELASMLGSGHRSVTSDDPIVVEAADKDDRKRLVISGTDKSDLDTRALELASLAAADHPVGTAQGLNALVNLKGRTLTPGQKVSLSELGYTAKRFAGRYSVSQLNFTMPSDFYPGDYSSMNLHLNALYVGGLAPEAVLSIKANSKVVANIPLSSTREGEIKDQRLPIPFSVLRPGQNTLQIEARLPSHLDNACDSVDKASAAVRLSISDNSYLEIPDYARIGRYPDIAVLTSGLTPKREGEADPLTYLFVPSYEKQGMNAAATFIAKMAYSSGRIKRVEFTSMLPELDTTNLIAFGSFDTLPSELMTRMKLDFINIRSASVKASPLEVASLDNRALPTLTTQTTSDAPDLASLWSRTANVSDYANAFMQAPVAQSTAALNAVKHMAAAEMQKLNLKYLPSLLDERREETFSPSADATLVVAQESSDTGGVWTVIASRKAETIETQTDILTDYNVWNKLGGAVQSLSDTGEILDQKVSAREYLFQTQPMTISNSRLVAAGWLANNAEIYVSALLGAAILLGIGTFLVLVTGRRTNG